MKPYRMLSTSGILGYGFPESSLSAALARAPDMIGVDGGSVDPGPYYLGHGMPLSSRRAMKRDLDLMLAAAIAHSIPMVIGSAGGAGGQPHLALTAQLVREIACERGLEFRMALIHAEQDPAMLSEAYAAGRISPLRNAPAIDRDTFARASRIVAMMGPEPFAQALDAGAQVVLAGRSSDAASWAGCAMRAGVPAAQAWFAGKMLECGASAATPKGGSDCLLVDAGPDGVTAEPANPERRCTPTSVATFALHENASPVVHDEPGGQLNTANAVFQACSDRAVRVTGMVWTRAKQYTVKLEAAECVGFRTITVCGTRDPALIAGIDDYIAGVRERVAGAASAMGIASSQYSLAVRCYGRDAVMGLAEPLRHELPHELGLVLETVAQTQELADAVAAMARTYSLHGDFPGRLCTEGNMAFPFSPADVACGPAYRFSLHHLLAVDDPVALFPIEYEQVR